MKKAANCLCWGWESSCWRYPRSERASGLDELHLIALALLALKPKGESSLVFHMVGQKQGRVLSSDPGVGQRAGSGEQPLLCGLKKRLWVLQKELLKLDVSLWMGRWGLCWEGSGGISGAVGAQRGGAWLGAHGLEL